MIVDIKLGIKKGTIARALIYFRDHTSTALSVTISLPDQNLN